MLKLSKQKITAIKIWWIRQIYKHLMWFPKLWYTLTMRLTKINGSKVVLYNDTAEIASSFDWGMLYKRDPLQGKLDYLAHPSRLAKNIADDALFGDCDDHAIWWCTTLLKSGLAKRTWFSFYTMVKKNSLEMSGHAICVLQYEDGTYAWTDYRLPSSLLEDWHKWPRRSAEVYEAEPVAACMIEVVEVKEDDTPVFGEITVLDVVS
jgi:hypothetical protein